MQANYEKPLVKLNEESAEGVYMASGDSSVCYTANAWIHQRPETGRGDYRIQLDAKHNADPAHSCDYQVVTLEFNMPVTYVSGGVSVEGGDGTPTLKIKIQYHNNPNGNIGKGDIEVKAEAGLAIEGVWVSDAGYTY